MSTKVTKAEDPMGVWPTVKRAIDRAPYGQGADGEYIRKTVRAALEQASNRDDITRAFEAMRAALRSELWNHRGVQAGKCDICGHHGQDCEAHAMRAALALADKVKP